MPIGPRGERLPYNGGPAMGAGPGPDLPPMGPPQGPPMAGPRPGGDIMAAKQRLMQIAAEAESILTEHPELAQELMGDGGVGGVPETAVAANTVPSGGGLLGGVV